MKHIILLLMALSVAYAPASYAATAKVKGYITKTVVADDGRWGGCIVSMNKQLSDFGLDCPKKWISFSCSGVFTEKDIAYRMFDQAQMAFAMERQVEIYVDDTKKHNGYCYGNRINVLK